MYTYSIIVFTHFMKIFKNVFVIAPTVWRSRSCTRTRLRGGSPQVSPGETERRQREARWSGRGRCWQTTGKFQGTDAACCHALWRKEWTSQKSKQVKIDKCAAFENAYLVYKQSFFYFLLHIFHIKQFLSLRSRS